MEKKSCNMTTAEVVRWMVDNNPGVVDIIDFGGAGMQVGIISVKPIEKLNFPRGWYYNEKNGMTNKLTSTTGFYSRIKIEIK